MGMGMARNILAAGIALKGHDKSEASRDRFAEIGGRAVGSAAEAATGVNLLILMVVNSDQVRDVLFGDGGAAYAMTCGSTVMLCSTIAPADVRSLASEVGKYGLLLLDAPTSGGKVGAEAGTLTIMASGPDEAFGTAEPVLDSIASTVHRLGEEPGIGATYKVVHQLAAGVHLVAAAELMALGAKTGCDPRTLFEIVSTSAGRSWMFENRVPHMLDGDYEPRSMVDIFIKDLDLVLRTGKEVSVPLPLSAAAHQMLLAASSLGHGQLDDSAVVKAYEALTGTSIEAAIDQFS